MELELWDSVWERVRLHPWKYRKREKAINGIIWHSTRGGQGYRGDVELNAYRNWVVSPHNRVYYSGGDYAGIAHYGIGPQGILECVPPRAFLASWSSWPSDEHTISVEVAQSNNGQEIEDETIAHCVRFALWASVEYGIPLVRVFPKDDWSWSGMAGHEDTVQGKRQGKSDPGESFWSKFIPKLQEAIEMESKVRALEERVSLLERILCLHGGLSVAVVNDNVAVLRGLGVEAKVGETVRLNGDTILQYLDKMENNMWLGLQILQERVNNLGRG